MMKINGILPVIVAGKSKYVAQSAIALKRIGDVIVATESGTKRKPGQHRDNQILKAFLSYVCGHACSCLVTGDVRMMSGLPLPTKLKDASKHH
jgi:hypothetical protein